MESWLFILFYEVTYQKCKTNLFFIESKKENAESNTPKIKLSRKGKKTESLTHFYNPESNNASPLTQL